VDVLWPNDQFVLTRQYLCSNKLHVWCNMTKDVLKFNFIVNVMHHISHAMASVLWPDVAVLGPNGELVPTCQWLCSDKITCLIIITRSVLKCNFIVNVMHHIWLLYLQSNSICVLTSSRPDKYNVPTQKLKCRQLKWSDLTFEVTWSDIWSADMWSDLSQQVVLTQHLKCRQLKWHNPTF
jgi:hypothetical protein